MRRETVYAQAVPFTKTKVALVPLLSVHSVGIRLRGAQPTSNSRLHYLQVFPINLIQTLANVIRTPTKLIQLSERCSGVFFFFAKLGAALGTVECGLVEVCCFLGHDVGNMLCAQPNKGHLQARADQESGPF